MTTRLHPWDPFDCETHEYRNPEGETVRWLTAKGTTGRFIPPIGITSVPIPISHGSRFFAAAHLERTVTSRWPPRTVRRSRRTASMGQRSRPR